MTTMARPAADDRSALPLALPAAALLVAVAATLTGANSQSVWIIVRASGIVAYLLVTLTVVCGLLQSGRVLPPGNRRVDLFEVHRFAALVLVGFSTFHAAMLLFDTYIGYSPLQVLVPFTSDYRPLSVALGSICLYLSLVIYLSFQVRRRIGMKAWRLLHYGSFVAYVLATLHGILSGNDTTHPWMLAVYFGSVTLVSMLFMLRLLPVSEERRPAALSEVTASRAVLPSGSPVAALLPPVPRQAGVAEPPLPGPEPAEARASALFEAKSNGKGPANGSHSASSVADSWDHWRRPEHRREEA